MNIKYERPRYPYSIIKSNMLQYDAHLHRDIEMIYMLDGQTKAYLDSVEYVLNKGDIFIAFPNKVHYYQSFTEERSLIMRFSPDYLEDFKSVFLKHNPLNPVIKKDELPDDFYEYIKKILNSYDGEAPFKEEKIKGFFNVIFSDIMSGFDYVEKKEDNVDMISSILSYCFENYKENITLDEMAKQLHASKYYISRLFSDKIKISLNNYINMLRVNDAKERLIKTNDSVTEIGTKVGYNTIRSFNRAFLTHTGMQPREFRNQFGNKISK